MTTYLSILIKTKKQVLVNASKTKRINTNSLQIVGTLTTNKKWQSQEIKNKCIRK